MTAPVSCCMIVRDDASTLEVCLKSIRPHVAELIVVDNGSQDDTVQIAKSYADRVETYTACNDEHGLINSFCEIRNYSFSLATKPWTIWFDGDDVVQGLEKLPEVIGLYQEPAKHAPVSVMFPYEYAHDAQGNATLVHYRERLISDRQDFEWVNDVHEVINPKKGSFTPQSDLVRVVHRRQFSTKKTESGRNLRILRRMYQKTGEKDIRLLYYLGMECGNNGFFDEAIKFLSRHVELSGWPDEQYMSCLLIIRHYMNRADYDNAIRWCQKAMLIREDWGEAYFKIAECFYYLAMRNVDQRRNWERCVHFAQRGLSFPPTKTSLFINPLDRSFEIHKYLNVALNALGDTQGAKESVETALAARPDASLESNRILYGSWVARRKVTGIIDELVGYGKVLPSGKDAILKLLDGQIPEAQVVSSCGSMLPESSQPSDPPEHLPIGVQLAAFQSLWKTLLLHDELLAARHLLKAVPWVIRGLPEVAEMQAKTNAILAHHDDPAKFAEHYSHTGDAIPNEIIPMPAPVPLGHCHKPRWDWLVQVLNEREHALGRKLDVLDIGSMDGWLTNRVGQMGHRSWGIDTSSSIVALASSKAQQFVTGAVHEVHDFIGASPVPGDFPKKYDVVVLYEVYEHLHDTVTALKKARSLLASGGVLVVSTPRGSWGMGASRPGHHAWDADSFREHIRAAIPQDLEHDFSEAGFHGFEYKTVDHTDGFIPGQATLLARGTLPGSKVEHIRSPLDIALYVGWNTEPWNPSTAAQTGIGGSETAAMHMARLLAARGNKVRIYAECNGLEGRFDGVDYLHYPKFRDIQCDALMVSRRPQALDMPNLSRKATFCWVHDVHCGSDLTHERALKIDRFLCLSQWHRMFFYQAYDFLHPSQMLVTRNGIELSRFNTAVARNPHRAVYSSSPDRGMEVAVRVWPLVRQRVPDAELHVYYGFQTWEACVQNDDGQKQLIGRLKQLLQDNAQHGVFFHGRVNQQVLAREYLASGVWAYPTWFTETSCISAMEAQAAGLRIVTSPIAALNETVGNRGTMVPGDWLSMEYQQKFVDEVVNAMNRPDDGDRNVLQTYARDNFSWEGVAQNWDSMFRKVIDEVQDRLVIPYRGAA